MLNPLPVPRSDQLIELDHGAHRLTMPAGLGLTAGLYFHYSERARTLESAAIYRTDDQTLTGNGDPERVRCAHATPTLGAVLKTPPAVGRWFTDAEGRPGASPVAVLSHALWTRRFDANAGILGRPVMLGGVATEIVGVMPASYAFPDPRVDVWIAEPLARSMGFGLWNYTGVARLRGGATLADARAELNGLIADVPKAYPGDQLALGNVDTRLFFSGRTLKDAILGSVARGLWILLASVGVVLLVACANVANLFLVRSDARQREVAVRRALGASAGSIARYFLAESILLSIAGGAIGLLLAWGAVRLLVASGPATLPRLHEIRLDAVAIAFTCGLSLAAAFAFGAIPLWRGAGRHDALPEMGRSNTASRSRHRARHLLMGAQIAMALVLLVSSGLMLRSFQEASRARSGFRRGVRTHLQHRSARSAVPHARLGGGRAPRHSRPPGGTARSDGGHGVHLSPADGRLFGQYRARRGAADSAGDGAADRDVSRGRRRVSRGDGDAPRSRPRHHPRRHRPLRAGRRGEPVARHSGFSGSGSDRPARRLEPPARTTGAGPELTWLTIVGVVANTALRTPAEAHPVPQIFMPISIAGGPGIPKSSLIGPDIAVMSYVVRSGTPPLGLLPSVRRAVDGVDRDLALAQVRTLQDMLDRASAQMAFTMALLAIAGVITMLLESSASTASCPTSSASGPARSACGSRWALSHAPSPR
jgi:hypothetical protein